MSTIHPADGLINRLLKQNAQPSTAADKPETVHSAKSVAKQDSGADSETPSLGKERRLESQLLQLYRANSDIKDRES